MAPVSYLLPLLNQSLSSSTWLKEWLTTGWPLNELCGFEELFNFSKPLEELHVLDLGMLRTTMTYYICETL